MFIGHLISIFVSTSIVSAVVAVPAFEGAVQDRAVNAITITGTIRSINGNQFIATFAANGITHSLGGTYSPPTQSPWRSSKVVLSFDNTSQLSGTQAFVGRVGQVDISLDLDSEVDFSMLSVSGPLDNQLAASVLIVGNGTWIQ